MRTIVALIFLVGTFGTTGTAAVGSTAPAQTARSPVEGKVDEGAGKEGKGNPSEAWKEEARTLAEAYRLALKQRYQTMPVSEKRKILKEIKEIKRRRNELLARVKMARLPRRDRIEIEEVLAAIPP